MEEQALEFLKAVYGATPSDLLNRWGMQRYSRFKTKCWKHLEESASLPEFVNRYFAYFTSSIPQVIFLVGTLPDEAFNYLKENLTILVGRLQASRRETTTQNESLDEEVEKDEL